jgi:hypothetical protein
MISRVVSKFSRPAAAPYLLFFSFEEDKTGPEQFLLEE